MAVAAIAAAAAWSAFALLTGGVFAIQDTVFTMVSVEHLQDAILHGDPWRDAPLSWLPDGIAQNDWVLGQAVLGLPLRLAGVAPMTAASWLSVAGMALTAVAGWRFARALGSVGAAAWLPALYIGFGPMMSNHAQHLNLVHRWPALLGCALMLGHTRRDAVLGGLLIAANLHFGYYAGMHGLLLGGLVLVAAATRDPRFGAWALGGMAVGGATMLPVIAPYLSHAAALDISLSARALQEALDLGTVLQPHADTGLGRLTGAQMRSPANPGYLVLLGAAYALWRRPSGRFWAAVAVATLLAALLALGPDIRFRGVSTGWRGPYAWVQQSLGGPTLLRGPERWYWVASTGLALFAGQVLPRRRLAVLLLPLALLELPRIPAAPDLPGVSPIYSLLDDAPPGALYEKYPHARTCQCAGLGATIALLYHQRPDVGASGYARRVGALTPVRDIAKHWPDATAEKLLRALGVRVVIHHPPLRGSPPPAGLQTGECQIFDRHLFCMLAETPPLPAPESVATKGDGPVVGKHFGGRNACDPDRIWSAVSGLRDTDGVDVFEPCDGGVPLVRVADAPWLPQWPASSRSVATSGLLAPAAPAAPGGPLR